MGTSPKSLDRHNQSISSSEEVHWSKKTEDLWRGWTPMSCKGQVQQTKAWLKNKSILSEDQKKKLDQGKDNSPVQAPVTMLSARPQQRELFPKRLINQLKDQLILASCRSHSTM
ncbi:hypothetical protein O181_024012 [Austropuccinia psidii MF-1]|uniref:Uncharacterized protein n=1 Tax=Austropuccinia psidii MF-1 TaxID=1389203 RepID=A0A9Q3CIF8_9BASI|nr:hypothetical protein [Austropuccinia psidii MF-1]